MEFWWIPVEWNLEEGPANLFIPVFSIPVEFWWILEFTQECSPKWSYNPFVYLLCIIIYLFVTNNKQSLFGNHTCQTWPLSFFFPPPPTMLVTTTSTQQRHQQQPPDCAHRQQQPPMKMTTQEHKLLPKNTNDCP